MLPEPEIMEHTDFSGEPPEATAPQAVYDPIEADYAAAPPVEDDYEEEYDWFAASSAKTKPSDSEQEETDSYDAAIPFSFLEPQPISVPDMSTEYIDNEVPDIDTISTDAQTDTPPWEEAAEEEPMTMQAPDGMKIDAETGEVEFVEINTEELEKRNMSIPQPTCCTNLRRR